jgi:small conductance mechanosensitive channel
MPDLWTRLAIAGGMIVIAAVFAKAVDARMDRRDLAPSVATRYRVVRRTVMVTIVFVGVLSALLVVPQVRAIAGGILASSAVLGIVIGFAAQRTLGNFVAGLSIAFTQPVRLGDQIEVGGTDGVVEEIGLTYTWVRTPEDNMLVIPNEKLASETILNKTIRKQV